LNGPKGQWDLTLKIVNKADVAQKKQQGLSNLEVQKPHGPGMKDFGE